VNGNGNGNGYGNGYGSSGMDGVMSTLASVPWFLLGLAAVTWDYVKELPIPFLSGRGRGSSRGGFSRGGGGVPYRQIPIDDDAEVLGEYLDDD